MKKKILIFILIILLNLIASITFIKYNQDKKITNNNNKVEEEVLQEALISINSINLCKDETNCNRMEDRYGTYSYNYKNEELQQWIKKENEKTEANYQEALNSNTNDETCKEVKDIYKHKYSNYTYHSAHNGEKIVALSVKRTKTNLCTKEHKQEPIETFFYSKEKQKEINQEELIQELNLTDELIQDAIKTNIKELNTLGNHEYKIQDKYSNYKLHYSSDGNILVEYLEEKDKQYYSATIYLDQR